MAQVDVIITPLTGNIVFYDNDLAAQNSVSIQGESQGVLYFAGDGVNIPSSGLTAPTSSTNPNQSALPYPGQAANASASNSLFVILDSITGTITPGLSGYEMGSSTLPWRYWGTSANFSGAITLAATSSLFLANTGGANGAPLTFSASASAPTSLSAGQMWWDGTHLFFNNGSSNVNLLTGSGGTITGTSTNNFVAYWNGTSSITGEANLALSRGGTNSGASASAGSIAYSSASAIVFNSVGSTGQLLLSGGTGTPTWSNLSSILTATGGAGITLTGTTSVVAIIDQTSAFTPTWAGLHIFSNGLNVSAGGIVDSLNALTTTSTQGFALQNTTASTGGATQQQSPGFDFIGHVWNTTPTAADNTARFRTELQVTSGTTPTSLLVWKSSMDTGTASFTNKMTLTNGGLLTVSNGLTITTGTFTIGSNTFALGSSSTLSTNSQTFTLTSSIGNVTIGAGTGTSATQHNLVQSGTTQYVLESATVPTALGDMYYASTTSYATMTKLSIGVRGSMMVTSTATPIPTWLAPSATAGVAVISGGTGADLAYGTVVVAGGGTGAITFTSNGVLYGNTTSAIQATAASGSIGSILQTTTAGSAPTWATSLPGTYTLSASGTPLTVSSGLVAISTTGSSGGLLLGGDLALYRGATTELYVVGNITLGTATAPSTVPTALAKRLAITNTTGILGLELSVVDGTLNPRAELFLDGSTALYGFDATFTNTNAPQFVIRALGIEQIRVTNLGQLQVSYSNIATTSTSGVAIQNTTASTSGVPAQQSSGLDFIGHVWNTTVTAADNTARFREELQVTSGTTPSATLVWKSSVDTGTASFTNKMTLTTGGILTVSGGLTITSGTFTIGSNTLALSSSGTLNLNSQTLAMNASIGNFTIGAGTGTSATQHNFVQSGTTQYILESATAPTALGDMYYASTTSYATMTKLSIGVRGATLVASTATPTPTWLAPSATAGVAVISGGTGADLAYGTIVVAGGGTGQATFASTNSVLLTGSSSTGAFATVTGASGILYTTGANVAPTFATSIAASITFSNSLTVSSGGLTVTGTGITDSINNITTTSTLGFALQNTTASTSIATQQQSPGLDYIGHVWNTTATAADNFARFRQELQVTSGTTPVATLVWKSSVDTGTASFTNRMTLTSAGLLTVSNGLTITAGTFTIGSFTFAVSSNSTLSTNSQSLIMNASIGNVTLGAGVGTSATQHNFVQSGTTQYVLESATTPTALGDMYYASTTSYATMTKLSIGVRGAHLVASTATPTPTWLAPSATAGVAVISGGTGADLAYGTVVVAGGGTGQASFASTNSLVVTGSSSTGAFTTVTGAAGILYTTAANTAPTFANSIGTLITFTAGLTVTTVALTTTLNSLTTTSTLGFALQNTTATTAGAVAQQSPGFDLIGHVWNTTATAADNFARFRQELQVTSGTTPVGTLVWKSSVDTGAASFTNRMTLTSAGLLTVSNGLTITAGTFTIGSFTFAVSSNSTLSTNSQSLIMNASIGNVTIGAGTGTSATQHNFVQSGTTQYVLESTTVPTALGDMYYASTTSYATMTKLSIGVRGAHLVASTATPTPTWLAPSATAGVAIISGGTGADLAYGTVVVAGGGTGQASFASTNSLVVTGSSSTGAFATVTGASGILYTTAANTAPTFTTSIGATITFSNGATISGGTFTLNTLESCTLTVTGTAPNAGRSDVDTWQPSGAPTTDYYAYYQQVKYDSNQANTFGIAGLRSDAITTATMTSATLARVDSMLAFYSPGHGGTVSQATGLRVTQLATWLGTTTNYMGIRIESNYTSGTLTNAAGLYIDVIGSKGSSSGASVYLVSDGTAKTGLSWGTSTSAYTADVGLFRSGAGTLTITGTATVTNGLTINNAKTTVAASATGYASLNIPAGTAPTSPSNGDTYYDSSGILWFYDGTTAKRINKHQASICMCAGYTPTGTGTGDVCEFVVPYKGDGTTQITYNVRRIDFRVGISGTGGSVTVEVYTGTSAFPAYGTATVIGTTTLTTGTYENSTTSSFTTSTVQSGNKVRFTPVTIAGTANWTVMLELEEA